MEHTLEPHLFVSREGSGAATGAIEAACAEADNLPEANILNTDIEQLLGYFVEKYDITIPVVDRESIAASHVERDTVVYDQFFGTKKTVKGEAYDVEVMFEGEADIFNLRPNRFDSAPPRARINGNKIQFSITGRTLDPDQVKTEIDNLLFSIERYLNWHRELWSGYRERLSSSVRMQLETRRDRLVRQKTAASKLASLGVRLKEKPGDSRTFVAPAVKQKIAPKLPAMKPALPPEPTLDQNQYEMILGLVRGAGRSIEQSSSRTRKLDEETLRDMCLVPLNSHFGTATGEAFNFNGKTDVLIRHEGGNLFVAEFKIWGGDKHFLETIDQLLSYLTWRDSKAAIVIFSRNVGFSSVVAKTRSLTPTHANFVKGPTNLDETSDQYVLSLPQDKERQVTVSILSFDLGC